MFKLDNENIDAAAAQEPVNKTMIFDKRIWKILLELRSILAYSIARCQISIVFFQELAGVRSARRGLESRVAFAPTC